MKTYFNIIVGAAVALLLFPFLGFPELWENIYVSVFAFLVGYTAMLLRHKVVTRFELDEETSLEDYVQELKERFRENTEEKKSERSISEVKKD